MKKRAILFLVLILLVGLLALPSQAASAPDRLTVQTRSGNYVFHTGDTFTYSYWLELTPDIAELLNLSDHNQVSFLKSAVLDKVSGNIMYDSSFLQIEEASMPNFHRSIVQEKSDIIGGTVLDGTLFDFTNGDLFFKALLITDDESICFRQKAVLIRVRFRVTAGNDTPVYLRTKLKTLDVACSDRTVSFIDNKNCIAILPFASYETIDQEQPQELLFPYVSDQAFDIRCIRTFESSELYLRPGAGVAVMIDGMSSTAEHIIMTEYTTGEDVFWFYDIPYGEYYVSCSYLSDNGVRYETDDPAHGEFVSIPSTGIIQALWLFEAAPLTVVLEGCPISDGIVYADGLTFQMTDRTVTLDRTDYKTLVVCTFNGDTSDIHTVYPVHMYVWMLSYRNGSYTAARKTSMDDILQYAGSSIRITGKKGIRMITGIPEAEKRALIAGTDGGYLLQEYGTLVAWESELGDNGLTLDTPGVKSASAYRRNSKDPVFRRVNGTVQYTNVLVGFTDAQCVPDLVMRPYMKLTDSLGESLVLYGGIVTRSIGHIAYQNRYSFAPGGSSYAYIWNIIHSVYGNEFDAEYVG